MNNTNKEIYKLIQSLILNLIKLQKKKNAFKKALKLSPQLKLDISLEELDFEIRKIQESLLDLSIVLKIDFEELCFCENLTIDQMEILENSYIKRGNKLYYLLYRKSNAK